MKMHRLFTFTVIGIVVSCMIVYAMTDAEREVWLKQVWVVHLTLDMPDLDPAAVQYAFFDYDPVPAFKSRVKAMSKFYSGRIENSKDEEEKQTWRNAGMSANWDKAFEDITGDKVYLLKDEGSISSNSPTGRQWVVTKATYLDKEAICWCIPVEPKIGKEINITLNRKSTFNLSAIFDEALTAGLEPKETQYPTAPNFIDEPKGHALYDKMIKALEDAQTLYYESVYWFGREGADPYEAEYKIWLKKPNYARMEAAVKNKITGTLVGDGEYFWIYWGDKKTTFEGENFESYGNTTYMKTSSPEGRHSIAHMANKLKAGMAMTILQPSRFHGGGSSLDEYFDGVRGIGVETVRGEECDIIEVSYMNNQRSKYFWLSRKDYLPRKLLEVVRVDFTLIVRELWSNVYVNVEIPDALFSWQPPVGWTEYKKQDIKERLLKPGTVAPDFELKAIDGTTIRLSDYRGKVVLINFWRVGCPPCRWEIPHLEKMYARYKDQGLVVIGFNSSDDYDIALDFLKENSVTYPNIVDVSQTAQDVHHKHYESIGGGSAVPMNYIIDREGRVADAWHGFDKDDEEFLAEKLEPLGFK